MDGNIEDIHVFHVNNLAVQILHGKKIYTGNVLNLMFPKDTFILNPYVGFLQITFVGVS